MLLYIEFQIIHWGYFTRQVGITVKTITYSIDNVLTRISCLPPREIRPLLYKNAVIPIKADGTIRSPIFMDSLCGLQHNIG